MADEHPISPDGIFQLPVIGKRDGRRRAVIGHTLVLDDEFTHTHLVPYFWHLRGGRPGRWQKRDGKLLPVYLHWVVFEHYHGPIPEGLDVDHIDRDKLNNLPSNLRAVTRSVNVANRNRFRTNTSGFTGVSQSNQQRGGKTWGAAIFVRGKRFYLGAFRDPRAAARAVNAAYRIHFPQVPIPNPEAEDIKHLSSPDTENVEG